VASSRSRAARQEQIDEQTSLLVRIAKGCTNNAGKETSYCESAERVCIPIGSAGVVAARGTNENGTITRIATKRQRCPWLVLSSQKEKKQHIMWSVSPARPHTHTHTHTHTQALMGPSIVSSQPSTVCSAESAPTVGTVFLRVVLSYRSELCSRAAAQPARTAQFGRSSQRTRGWITPLYLRAVLFLNVAFQRRRRHRHRHIPEAVRPRDLVFAHRQGFLFVPESMEKPYLQHRSSST
jgi:hypothetical protein